MDYLKKAATSGIEAGNFREALSCGEKIKPLRSAIMGFMLEAEYNFYYSLSITAAYPDLTLRQKVRFLNVLRKNQREMRKWAKFCKENFKHRYLLVAAEIARLKKKKETAMSLYDEAINLTKENSYVMDEALANELAAKFYLSLGLKHIGKMYMKEAYGRYNSWQAYAKAKELKEKYGELLEEIDKEKEEKDLDRTFEDILSVSAYNENEIAKSFDTSFLETAVESLMRETDINSFFHNFLDIALKCVG